MQIRPISSLGESCPLDACPGFSRGSNSTPGCCDAYAPEEEHGCSSTPWTSNMQPPRVPGHTLDCMGTMNSSESFFGVVVQSMGRESDAIAAGQARSNRPKASSIGGGTTSTPDGCYVLKLSRSPDSISSHYSLTRVCSQAIMPLHLQLQMSWITTR